MRCVAPLFPTILCESRLKSPLVRLLKPPRRTKSRLLVLRSGAFDPESECCSCYSLEICGTNQVIRLNPGRSDVEHHQDRVFPRYHCGAMITKGGQYYL